MHIIVSVSQQQLFLYDDRELIKTYPVGTARNGVGQKQGSEQTPLGRHEICAMMGGEASLDSIFIGREPTGEIYSAELEAQFPERDFILTRILWLKGLQPEFNSGGDVDSQSRYIYIHGSPDRTMANAPASRGCINMSSTNVVDLFLKVQMGTLVEIVE
jgi:lipoprotein-anchoring transpeptidase ErfK/SrfK